MDGARGPESAPGGAWARVLCAFKEGLSFSSFISLGSTRETQALAFPVKPFRACVYTLS